MTGGEIALGAAVVLQMVEDISEYDTYLQCQVRKTRNKYQPGTENNSRRCRCSLLFAPPESIAGALGITCRHRYYKAQGNGSGAIPLGIPRDMGYEKMTTLYKLALNLEELVQTEEVSDQDLQTAFSDLSSKVESICQFLVTLDGEIALFKAEENRISTKRKSLENLKERCKDQIKNTMTLLMVDNLKAGTFSLSVQPTAGKVVILDEVDLPQEYWRIIPESLEVDKKQIAEDIKAGLTVPGAYVEPGSSLRLR